MKTIGIAIGSTCSAVGDVGGNLFQISDFAKKAAADGADILLTPEMSTVGWGGYPEVLAAAEEAGHGKIYDTLCEISAANGVVVSAGFPEAVGDKRYIAQYIVYPTGKYVVQRKHRVTIYEQPFDSHVKLKPRQADEHSGQPEDLCFNYFDVCGVRCVQVICYDWGIKDLQKILADHHVELAFLSTAGGGSREERITLKELTTEKGMQTVEYWTHNTWPSDLTDCIRYRMARAAVNMCGYDGKSTYHGGGGTIVNTFGEIVGFLPFTPVLERMRPSYNFAQVEIANLNQWKDE